MVFLSFPHHHGPGVRRKWLSAFPYRLLELAKGDPLPAVVHLHRAVLPFADQGLALRRSIAPLSRLQLQAAALKSDHPIVANAAFGLQPENLSQFAVARLSPVTVLGRAASARDSPRSSPRGGQSVGCAPAGTLVPDTGSRLRSSRSSSAATS